jgi:16S rRNA (adenine1518-N6/adenine1519-N6)-dimethyltransferase
MLTHELCRNAESVVAVEIDRNLFSALSREGITNLRLVNKDFFRASDGELGIGKVDIMISNVPYDLSSKVIDFIISRRLEAVLYLQKEFVERMTASPGTRNYSRLSVMSQLCLSITKIMDVGRGNFEPVPKVDSALVYLKPKSSAISDVEKEAIALLMQHKKKTVRNALLDSLRHLDGGREAAGALAKDLAERNERVFKLSPEELLSLAKRIGPSLRSMAPGTGRV